MILSNYHLDEPLEPMPFLDWAVLHISEKLPELPRCERHGVTLIRVEGKGLKCSACVSGTRPVYR